jgi:cytochrome bd-type quinol oxidase subunit 2
MDRIPSSPPMRTTFGRIVLGMAGADIAIVVAGVLSAGGLDRCRYPGEAAESTAFVAMMIVILVATVAVVLLARRLTRSWPLTMVILCVQLSTSIGVAFLPFVMRLGPTVCSG